MEYNIKIYSISSLFKSSFVDKLFFFIIRTLLLNANIWIWIN